MKNSLKDIVANPLPKILDLIPYTDTILDPKLLDSISLEFMEVGIPKISNQAIVLLLLEFSKLGLITLTVLTYPSTLGQIFILKRNIVNG